MANKLRIKFVHSAISEEESERIMLEIFDLLLGADYPMVASNKNKSSQNKKQKYYETIYTKSGRSKAASISI